jgi:hypothetical protein
MLPAAFVFASLLLLQLPGPGEGSDALPTVTLPVPGSDWLVSVAPDDFEFGEPYRSSDGTKIIVAGDGLEPGFEMIVLVERSDAADATGCRAGYAEQIQEGPVEATRWRYGELHGMPTFEYRVRSYRNVSIDQQNLHGFLFRNGHCVHVHLSLLNFKGKKHELLMEQALAAVSLVQAPEPSTAPDKGNNESPDHGGRSGLRR